MLTKENLIKFLNKIFPNDEIIFEGEGWSSIAFTVGNNIVRFSKANNISGYKKESDILNFLNSRISFEIPKTEIVYQEIPFVTHKKIDGFNWNAETYEKLSQKEKNLFSEDIARFFVEMHTTPIDDAKNELFNDYMDSFKPISYDKMFLILKENFNEKEIEKIYNNFKKLLKPVDEMALLHQDFYENNSLIDENHRLKGVFDFGGVGIKEKSLEFRTLCHPHYSNLFKNVCHNYEALTGSKINLDRLNELNKIDCVGSLVYLYESGLKDAMCKEWNENIQNIKKIL